MRQGVQTFHATKKTLCDPTRIDLNGLLQVLTLGNIEPDCEYY